MKELTHTSIVFIRLGVFMGRKVYLVATLLACSMLLFSCNKEELPSSNASSSIIDSSSSNDEDDFVCPNEDISLPSKIEFNGNEPSSYSFPSFSSSEGLTFTLSDTNDYYICSNKNYGLSSNTLAIPSTYNGLPVKKIASEAFTEITWLESIYIPSSIEEIGDGAFSLNKVKKIYFDAENVKDFNARNWVFYSSSMDDLEVYIGPNCKRIPANFMRPLSTDPKVRRNVTKLIFDKNSSLKEIGDYAFFQMDELNLINFPSSIEKIGSYSFYGCGLSSTNLENVRDVGSYSFSYCENLKEVKFGSNLLNLGQYSFAYSSLKQVDLSLTQLKEISSYCFYKDEKLERIDFPTSLILIDEYAFAYTDLFGLDTFNVATIEEGAFVSSSLKELRLSNVTNLKEKCFYDLSNLNKLVISSNISSLSSGNNVFTNLGKNSQLNVIFSSSVSLIPSRLFFSTQEYFSNPNISSLYFYSSIQKIEKYAFYGAKIEEINYIGTPSNFSSILIEKGNENLTNIKYRKVNA